MADDPKKVATPGEWYVGVPCANCKRPIALFHDPSKGVTKLVGGNVRVTCTQCGHDETYPMEQLKSAPAQRVH